MDLVDSSCVYLEFYYHDGNSLAANHIIVILALVYVVTLRDSCTIAFLRLFIISYNLVTTVGIILL